MSKVIYEKDGRIGRVTLNRPEVLNAIDDELPAALADCVARANSDPGVHVIVLSGAGRAFCAGYDLSRFRSAIYSLSPLVIYSRAACAALKIALGALIRSIEADVIRGLLEML